MQASVDFLKLAFKECFDSIFIFNTNSALVRFSKNRNTNRNAGTKPSNICYYKNYHITNKEIGNKIIFLRKLAPGGSVHSFGIHVARMAGMPPALIDRANDILKQLETKHVDEDMQDAVKKIAAPQLQLSIFDAHSDTFNEIRKMLEKFDINRLTPVEALMKLNEIKNLLN